MHDEMTETEYVNVIQHEQGYFIDNVLGSPLMETTFSQAYSDTAFQYKPDTFEGHMYQ